MKHTLFLQIIACLAVLTSCSNDEIEGAMVSDNMEYWVEIGTPIENEGLKLGQKERAVLLEDLLSKARNKDLPVYYYLSDTLIPLEDEFLEEIFHHVDTEYVQNDQMLYDAIPIENELDMDAIVKLKFLEQWYFNEKTNVFIKKVKAICPMVEVYKNEKEILGYKGLFWIGLN